MKFFSDLFQLEAFKKLGAYLSEPSIRRIKIQGVAGSSLPLIVFYVQKIYPDYHQLIVCDDLDEAYDLMDDFKSFSQLEENFKQHIREICFFPTPYKSKYNISHENKHHLLHRNKSILHYYQNKPLTIISYPQAFVHPVPAKKIVEQEKVTLHIEQEIDPLFLSEWLQETGFIRSDMVSSPGEFSMRGSILDVFSFAEDYPVRIIFDDNEIKKIKYFHPIHQLTIRSIDSITLLPDLKKNSISPGTNFLSLLPPEKTIVWLITTQLSELIKKEESIQQQINENTELKLVNLNEILLALDSFVHVSLSGLSDYVVDFHFKSQPLFHGKFDWLIRQIIEDGRLGWKYYIFSTDKKQLSRLESILEDLSSEDDDIFSFVQLKELNLNEGFVVPDLKLAFYTEHQLFKKVKQNLFSSSFDQPDQLSIETLIHLQPGDYVVHINHGIGRFAGLEKMIINGKEQEVIRLIYRDNDEVYVNIHSLHKISKYVGKDGQIPQLDKLGSQAWQNKKNKIKKKVKDIARELIQLYAKRKASKGIAFSPDNYLQFELEASFMYQDTQDQIRAMQEIKEDMEKPVPMDRLLCGDVGFGKTELAVRAAFKAVLDGYQVAVLVPTTILAFQHYQTFRERLDQFNVRIDFLSRFKTPVEQKEIIEKLFRGEIDIIIGTHKLLGKEIRFHNLGLLIIDEEQKFGVVAKEKIRMLKENVDTLTLTATPIPRTLQFSLMGARDMSLLRTPPPNRYPVHTEVLPFSPDLIRDAIRFELNRGGQVFFIHNIIQNIDEIARLIHELVPEAKIAVAHGQIKASELESIMLDFYQGKTDVLVSTAIVESGLDILNANTIFINNAHMFGLSDLHQLRGRVGRSGRKAFCYLFTPPDFLLTESARKRLRTIMEFSDLGSGFQIALRDLDIRGAGNLLGAEQSGFITEIGFEMYQKILDEAIQELKRDEFAELYSEEKDLNYVSDVNIETDLSILIPDTYVSSSHERYLLYKKLNDLTDQDEIQQFIDYLQDRFGPIPPETLSLFDVIRCKWKARKAGIEKIILKKNVLYFHFVQDKNNPFYSSPIFNNLLQFVLKHAKRTLLQETETKLVFKMHPVYNFKQTSEIIDEILSCNTVLIQ
ncbi:MAG: transcription-repair coupling factor [Bacteroidales bacterium]|nr:transcription-repair coupling factor [Bacteroidales bacterium]